MPTSYPLGGIGIQNNSFGSVDLFNTEYFPANYSPTVGAQPAGQDGLTDPAGLVLARAVAGADLEFWVPGSVTQLGQPVGVLGADVINATPAVDINLRYIGAGTVRREKLVFFDPVTGTYKNLSTLTGIDPIPTPEEAYDLLKVNGIRSMQTLQLDSFDNA